MSTNPLADKIANLESLIATQKDTTENEENMLKAIDSFCLGCGLNSTKDCSFCYLNPYSPYKSGGDINA
jgi:hypothetical protein